jgi:Fe2+ or Zn2+ uptake regulation protein
MKARVRFIDELIRQNESVTQSRVGVYWALGQLERASAAEIEDSLKGEVSRRTIYRSLEMMVRIGVAEQLGRNRYQLTERFRQHGHTLACINCGRRAGS